MDFKRGLWTSDKTPAQSAPLRNCVRLGSGNGDITIRGKSGLGGKELEIIIADGSVVEGGINVRNERRKVTVILSGGGRVEGAVTNAEVIQQTP